MQEIEIYNIIRQEIITNHTLMHWLTLFVFVSLLVACVVIEKRKTILSVFLPLLTLAWAASIVRFDFFIHRQGAYLRSLESHIQNNVTSIPLWETWKASHDSGIFIVPLADIFIFIVIIIPTAYILFNHTQEYFAEKRWKAGKPYAWTVLVSIVLLLSLIPFIPTLAQI
jgi:hypothetical protein